MSSPAGFSHAGSSRTGDVLAVVSQIDCAVRFHDPETGERLAETLVPAQPHELCFDPARRLLYVTHPYHSGWYFQNDDHNSVISVLDADRGTLVDLIELAPERGPHDVFLDQERDLLYVSVESNESGPGAVLVLDPERRTVLRRLSAEAHGPHWFVLSPDGKTCYTANKEAPFVSVMDTVAEGPAGRIPVPGSEGIAITPDGGHVLVAGPANVPGAPSGEPGVRVIDTATGSVVRTIATEHRMGAVHVTANGTLLAAESRIQHGPDGPQAEDGDLLIHRAGTFEPLARIGIGKIPLTIRSSPDGTRGYLTNAGSGTVQVIDLTGNRVLNTFDGGPGAHGLAYIPAA